MESIFSFYFPSCASGLITVSMTTDACGIVAPIPWELLADDLPPIFSVARARRALGTFFLPRTRTREMTAIIEDTLRSTGWGTLEWRRVPVSFDRFSAARREHMPAIVQVAAVANGPGGPARGSLDKARAYLELHAARHEARGFSVVSLSTQMVIYKGLLSPAELPAFYPDLRERAFGRPFATVHRKISHTAAPLWAMAPPVHAVAGSGELRQAAASA